ncbi:hypothetical protein SDC9_180717 [bioreactor metagenome]|uniref:Uncharacterized protein n=1 Tax=bioreactor metagenome TaxID=1076179 RepID=A0A645HBQ3_9ZZZZ
MLAVEVICIEINAAGGDPGFVDAGQLTHHLGGVAGIILQLIAQICGDLHHRFSHHSGSVRPETDGPVAAVGAFQLSVRHHYTDGKAVVYIVKIAVHPGHHAVALTLKSRGRGGDGVAGGENAAVGDNGRHSGIRCIGDEIFRPKIVIGIAPEYIGGQLSLLMHQGVPLR